MIALRILFPALLVFPALTQAQTVEVKKEEARIEGQNTSGYQVAFQAPVTEVKNSLGKYLKTFGKVRSSGDYLTVAEPFIGGTQYNVTLYATTKQLAGTTAAWIGFSPVDDENSRLSSDLEKLTHDFGVTFHKEKIQMQIDESMQALEAVEKQQLRLSNQNKDLHNKIERNKREKTQLERSLEENKLELEQLTRDLAANGKAQDSVDIATGQIKKVVEMHKERQRNVK